MNRVNDFLLETFLDTQPSPSGYTARATPLRRALLTSVGETAHAVCKRVLVLAEEWLGVTPPIAHWAPAESGKGTASVEGQDAALAAAIDTIALRKVADDLRRAGYELQSSEELTTWIVIGDADNPLPAPAAMQSMVETLRQMAWSRIRTQVAVRVMVMVEPIEADALAAWQRQVSACAPAIYFSSPINLRRLRLEAHDHIEQTAVGLTTFLCGAFPSHAQPAGGKQLAIGAAAWSAPTATVQRGLMLHSAIHLVERVRSQLEQYMAGEEMQGEPDGTAGRIHSLEQCDNDLAAVVPFSTPAVRWRDLNVTWEDLDDLRSVIPARLARREARLEQAARQQRMDWLDQRMEAWGALLVELDQLQCSTGDGAPPLRQYARALQALQNRFGADLDVLATAFERSDQRIQNAEEHVEGAWKSVETLCSQLPRMTTKGMLFAALQPWMWPIWPYAYRVILPQEGQRLLDSLAHSSKVRWHEANWHILRQMTLAMAQDVNQRLQTIERLATYSDTLRTHLVAELQALTLPAPWTQTTLRTLWEISQSNIPALVTFASAERPTDWLSETIHACAARLTAHFTTATSFVERWSVLDFLAQPFRNSEDGNEDAANPAQKDGAPDLDALPAGCVAWLTELVESALPLWPDPAVAPVSGTVGWCLLPPPTPGMADSGYGPEAIRNWCENVVNLSPAALTGRTLAILRWAPVGIGNETVSPVAVDEEAIR